jgi:ubiquinone/menaquinone biosynthesis C-methylase UbiE
MTHSMSDSYSRSAACYDVLYAALGKDYEREVEIIRALIQQHKQSPGNTLLDVGCGTGKHMLLLKNHYQVEGLDNDAQMLNIAQQRLPDVPLHQGSMIDFDLGKQFDSVVCLFSAIGYVLTTANLNRAIHTMSRHLNPGGVLIIEPWLTPDDYHTGNVHMLTVNQPDLKITRMNVSERSGNISTFDFHFLVGTSGGVEHFVEHHELGLFTHEEYLEAFRKSDLQVSYNADGLTGRGLYIGVRQQ